MSRGRRATLGHLSMVLGATVMAAGLGIRIGVIPINFGGGSGGPQPSGSLASGGPGATPAGALASRVPQATLAPTATAATAAPPTVPPTPTPTPTPAPEAGTQWFADDFDAIAAWPVGALDWLTADVAGGQYHIVARPTDLPVFVMAAAGEGSPGPTVRVTALLAIGADADPATGAGLALEDAAGARLLAMVSRDGRVTLLRDSIESLDLLASGSVSPPSGAVELTLSLSAGTAAVAVDGIQVASARATLSTMGVGLAVWAVGGPAVIDVDAYSVWAGGGAAPP